MPGNHDPMLNEEFRLDERDYEYEPFYDDVQERAARGEYDATPAQVAEAEAERGARAFADHLALHGIDREALLAEAAADPPVRRPGKRLPGPDDMRGWCP